MAEKAKSIYGAFRDKDKTPFVNETYCDDVESAGDYQRMQNRDGTGPNELEDYTLQMRNNTAGAYIVTQILLVVVCIPSLPVNLYGLICAIIYKYYQDRGNIDRAALYWRRTQKCMLVGLLLGFVVYLVFSIYMTATGKVQVAGMSLLRMEEEEKAAAAS